MPDKAIADAGYGSEDNYAFMADNEIAAYVKVQLFSRGTKTLLQEQLLFNRELLL
jgi:hypothetical protein